MNPFQRMTGMLLHPVTEWQRVRSQAPAPRQIWTYAALICAISAVAHFVALTVTGHVLPGLRMTISPVDAVPIVLARVATTLVSFALLAWILRLLAPRFGGAATGRGALALSVYSATASVLAGIGELLPIGTALVALAGVVASLITLWHGLPVMLDIAPHRRTALMAGALVTSVACSVGAAVLGRALPDATHPDIASRQMSIDLPDGRGTIDMSKMQATNERMIREIERIREEEERTAALPERSRAESDAIIVRMTGAFPERIGTLRRLDLQSDPGQGNRGAGATVTAMYVRESARDESARADATRRDAISDIHVQLTERQDPALANAGKYAEALKAMTSILPQGQTATDAGQAATAAAPGEASDGERTWQADGRTHRRWHGRRGDTIHETVDLPDGMVLQVNASTSDADPAVANAELDRFIEALGLGRQAAH